MKLLLSIHFKYPAVLLTGLLVATGVHAALFEDDEARKAILELRQRVELIRTETDQVKKTAADENAAQGRSLLELQRQMELIRAEVSSLRGLNEQSSKELTDIKRQQRDQSQALNERISKFEPIKVTVDGVEFLADPAEKRDYESALAIFRKGDFSGAISLFATFISRNSGSPYVTPALFWLGNAQYATRDYKDAIINFRALIAKSPEHLRAPESVLSVANCQLELKDSKGARKTLADLIKAYPATEAAIAAKERLASLK